MKHNYWVVSVSYDLSNHIAYIVEADKPEEIYKNPTKTLLVDYKDLKYKYMDIEKETQKEIKHRKERINPEVLFNPNTTLEQILSLPEAKNFSEERIKHLKSNLKDIKNTYKSKSINSDFERKILEEVKKDMQKDYNETKNLSEQELYKKIKKDFVQKSKYTPEEVSKVTPYILERAGHLMGLREFQSLEIAMKELYLMWENIVNDPILSEEGDIVEKSWRYEGVILNRAVKFFKPENKI